MSFTAPSVFKLPEIEMFSENGLFTVIFVYD